MAFPKLHYHKGRKQSKILHGSTLKKTVARGTITKLRGYSNRFWFFTQIWVIKVEITKEERCWWTVCIKAFSMHLSMLIWKKAGLWKACLMLLQKSIPPLKVNLLNFQMGDSLYSSGSRRKRSNKDMPMVWLSGPECFMCSTTVNCTLIFK